MGEAASACVFVEQQLPLQVAGFYVVAVDDADESDARPRQGFGLHAAQSAASDDGDAALKNALLTVFADFTVTDLARVALVIRASHLFVFL